MATITLYQLFYNDIYGPDAHDPLFVLTMIVTLIHSYFMYRQALCLRFSHFTHFIYFHCSLFLHRGIIHLVHQPSPYVQDLVSSRDEPNSFKKALLQGR